MKKNTNNNFIETVVYYEPKIDEHIHRNLELVYVLEGKVNIIADHSVFHLEKDDIYVINSGMRHSIYHSIKEKNSTLIAVFKISYDFICDCLGSSDIDFMCNSCLDVEKWRYDELRDVLKRILKDYVISSEKVEFIQMSDYYRLLHILTDYFRASEITKKAENISVSREDMIKNFVENNYDSDIGLEDLAKHVNLSVSYLSRYFKKTFGKNFVDYISDIRLEKAKDMLLSTDEPVTNIAFNAGFPNMIAFNKRFKDALGMTPSEYRKQNSLKERDDFHKTSVIAMNELKDYLNIYDVEGRNEIAESEIMINADISKYRKFKTNWNKGINIGMVEDLLDSGVQAAVVMAKNSLDFKYGRIINPFTKGMYITDTVVRSAGRFARLNKVLNFLVNNNITPVIELGEIPKRINKNIKEDIKEFDNKSAFDSYKNFIETIEDMMSDLVFIYSEQEVNNWVFELWDDPKQEMFDDHKPYMTRFRDIRKVIKMRAPKAKLVGSGNHIGWTEEHTNEIVRCWVDNGIRPDIFSFSYAPYAVDTIQSERLTRRKSDEDDLKHSIEKLNQIMKKYGFPTSKIYISSWNMTNSSRNYFNDSLWKACYVVKSYIDNIELISGLIYSQLSDLTTDYYDNQQLINGSGGLITRDMIAKPAFYAMEFMTKLNIYLVDSGDNYIITRDEYGNITILMHNFIGRNYLYFLKEENENTLRDHYTYFLNQDSKTFHFKLDNMINGCTYELHHKFINREHGSIIDEWADFGFRDDIRLDDIEYLRRITTPGIGSANIEAKDDCIEFDVTLKPLEVRCINIRNLN